MLPNLTESELSSLDGLVDEPQEAFDEPASDQLGGASDIEAAAQDERGHGALEALPFANLDLLRSVDRALSLMLGSDLAVESGASLSDLIRIRELYSDKGHRTS